MWALPFLELPNVVVSDRTQCFVEIKRVMKYLLRWGSLLEIG